MALRVQLWLDLPLSQNQLSYSYDGSQFWHVLIDVRYGSSSRNVTSNQTTVSFRALRGRSELLQVNGSVRPGAEALSAA